MADAVRGPGWYGRYYAPRQPLTFDPLVFLGPPPPLPWVPADPGACYAHGFAPAEDCGACCCERMIAEHTAEAVAEVYRKIIGPEVKP